MRNLVLHVSASLLLALSASLLIPGCVLRIETGTGDTASPAADTPITESSPNGPNDDGLTADELEVIQALEQADPAQLQLGMATAAYAATLTASLMEAEVSDPALIDDAALAELYQTYIPQATEQALLWSQSVDPTTLATPWNAVNFACEEEPYTCPRKDYCSFGGDPVPCIINQCGTGPCPTCPWPLKNLIIKAWCVYGCGRGDTQLGFAFRLITKFPLKLGEFACLPWIKP